MSHSEYPLRRTFSLWKYCQYVAIDMAERETHRNGTVAFSVLITFNPLARGDLLVA
jgi:hypothetical protein